MGTPNDEDQMMALAWAFGAEHFVMRFHAFVEMQLDDVRYDELVRSGSNAELLEEYTDRPQGHSKLLLGFVGPDRPIHLVVNVAAYEADPAEPLEIVTVYRPEAPRWRDERTRGDVGE